MNGFADSSLRLAAGKRSFRELNLRYGLGTRVVDRTIGVGALPVLRLLNIVQPLLRLWLKFKSLRLPISWKRFEWVLTRVSFGHMNLLSELQM